MLTLHRSSTNVNFFRTKNLHPFHFKDVKKHYALINMVIPIGVFFLRILYLF